LKNTQKKHNYGALSFPKKLVNAQQDSTAVKTLTPITLQFPSASRR